MFSKLALFFVAIMAAFVVALPNGRDVSNSCNSGTTYCCNSVQDANAQAAQAAQREAGILSVLAPISGNVGLTCNPITAIALERNGCTTQAACCSGNTFKGLVVVGCSPINV